MLARVCVSIAALGSILLLGASPWSCGTSTSRAPKVLEAAPLPPPHVHVSPPPAPGWDLDVLYVSRTPRPPRYVVSYGADGPTSWTGGEWPAEGETVTFTAVVKNSGATRSGCFGYEWLLDGRTVRLGDADPLDAGGRATFAWAWSWDSARHQLAFRATPHRTWDEPEANNERIVATNALTFRFHVEPAVYARFNALKNVVDTTSFEDWAQAHVNRMNEMMESSGEAVVLDDVVVEDGLPAVGTHAPEDVEWDGRWGFDDAEWTPGVIEREVGRLQNALIHELGHQIGLIDEYRFNFDSNYADQNEVNGQTWYLPYHAIMNDLNTPEYSAHALGALTSDLGRRRGFFGEYLYDIPARNNILLVDSGGAPLPRTNVAVYQADSDQIQNVVVMQGTTDAAGQLRLANRQVKGIATPTGHTLRPNPFGQINVVGTNGLFLVEATVGGHRRYGWLSLYRFNLAYWGGQTAEATYTVMVK